MQFHKAYFYYLRLIFLFLILIPLFIFISPVHSYALDKVSIQFKWFHQFQFAGYYAAKEKGFFLEEGLDVELREFSPKSDPIADVVSGKANYGIADTGLLVARHKGQPVVMVGQIFQHSPLVLLTLKKSGLRTPFDLKGKKLMTYLDGSGDAALRAMVHKALGDDKLANWVQHSFDNRDLLNNKIDAILAYSTNEPYWFMEKGIAVDILDPRDYGIDFYSDNFFTSDNEVQNNPKRVEKMLRASLKGWQYSLDNPDEIIQLILDKYNTQKKSRSHLEFEARQIAELIDAKHFKLGHFEPTRFKKIAGNYQKLSIIDKQEVPAGFLWGYAEDNNIKAKLTDAEAKWAANNTVKVGLEEWHPIVFAGKDGRASGLAGGYLDLISQRTGLKFEYVNDVWDKLINGLKNKSIDLLPATYYTDERSSYGLYSKPYFLLKEFIYVRSDNQDINSLEDLKNKRIAVVKGYGTIPKLKKHLPKAVILETTSQLASINAVLNGEADALMEAQMAIQQVLIDNSIVGLKGVNQTVFPSSPIYLFSRIDKPILHSILQKGLDTVTKIDRMKEQNKWLGIKDTSASKSKISLSPEEEQWLTEHRTIRLGDDFKWPPFSFRDENGLFSGIASGYLDVISERLGVEIKPVFGMSFTEAINQIKSYKLDIIPAIAHSVEREEFLNFTKPYISFPIVVASRKNGVFIDRLSDLVGLKVGVVKGYIAHELLINNHPELSIVTYSGLSAGLEALNEEKIDAFIDNLGSITYLIDKHKHQNLKIAAPTDYRFELSIGVRKDWPELVTLLNRALDSISDREQTAIKNSWMAIQFKFGLDIKTILIWAVPTVFVVLAIIFFVSLWNRRLSREINEREQIQNALSRQTQLLGTTMQSMSQGIIMVGPDGRLISFNDNFLKMFEFEAEYIRTQPTFVAIVSDWTRRQNQDAAFSDRVLTNSRSQTPLNWEQPVQIGRTYEIQHNPLESGGFVQTFSDITQRKRDAASLEFTRYAVDHAIEAVMWVKPQDGSFEYVNDATCKSMGYSREELLKLHVPDINPHFDASAFQQLKKGLENNKFITIESQHLRKDGQLIDVELTVYLATYLDQNLLVANAKDITERKKAQKERDEAFEVISDSIQYASRIQKSILPLSHNLDETIPNRLVIWEPRDVVGGDMYWCRPWGDGYLVMLGDCTGHGVPGAFMTLISNGALGQAYREIEPGKPGLLLQRIHQLIQSALGQHLGEGASDDGLELGVCYLNSKSDVMIFSGARFELFILEGKEVAIIKGTKKGTGYRGIPKGQIYNEETVQLRSGQRFYMTSDGIIDQVGGEKRRGFGKRKFKSLLLESHDLTFAEQKNILLQALKDHQGKESRRDDVSIIGFSLDKADNVS
ncbi:MAG: transporter substrate-binding domain-containing protein [Magnetococcales bacterium]|nr:transporter substrate-binding domain-containing protein [Magnetococcales bacterium]